jgi:hypothetical protein
MRKHPSYERATAALGGVCKNLQAVCELAAEDGSDRLRCGTADPDFSGVGVGWRRFPLA